jgi:hypothetical protein
MKRALTSLVVKIAAVCACNVASAHASAGIYMGVPGPDYVALPPLVTYEPYSPPDVQPYPPPVVPSYPAPVVYGPPPDAYGPPPGAYGYGYGGGWGRPHWHERGWHRGREHHHRHWGGDD